MAGFRDFLNRVLSLSELTSWIAVADDMKGRSVRSSDPSDKGMTPARLGQILRAADEGDVEAYFDLAENMEERDPHYLSVLNTRKRSVAQLPITVKPASDSVEHKMHAQLIQDWLDDGVLRMAMFDMLDAIGKGFSVTEIDWQYDRKWMLPRQLTWKHQRWFTFDRTDGETVLLREGSEGVPLAPHKFIVHKHKAKSGLTVRSGIARVICWNWMFKSFTIKDWAVFVQNYGQPIRLGRYGRNATEKEKATLWKAVSRIAGDCAAIIPKEMMVEFVETGSKGATAELYEKRADWIDRQTSKVVLGQTTTTDAVAGGHAVSQEHRLVQEDIERADALLFSATLCETLIPNIVAFNFGPQEKYPRVMIGRPDEIPLDQFAKAFEIFAKQGLTAPASYLRDRLGIPVPEKDDEIVGGRKSDSVSKDQTAAHSFDRLFKSSHSAERADNVDLLTARMERDAAGAMSGLVEEVRKAIEEASDLRDAAERLAKLDLDPDALADAMARGMALAHLAGQAAMVDIVKASK